MGMTYKGLADNNLHSHSSADSSVVTQITTCFDAWNFLKSDTVHSVHSNLCLFATLQLRANVLFVHDRGHEF